MSPGELSRTVDPPARRHRRGLRLPRRCPPTCPAGRWRLLRNQTRGGLAHVVVLPIVIDDRHDDLPIRLGLQVVLPLFERRFGFRRLVPGQDAGLDKVLTHEVDVPANLVN